MRGAFGIVLLLVLDGCILFDETPPGPLKDLRVKQVWSRNVIIEWTDPREYDFKEVWVCYAEAVPPCDPTAPLLSPAIVTVVPGGSFELHIADLPRNGREYRFTLFTADYALNYDREGQTVTATPIGKPKKMTRRQADATKLFHETYTYDIRTGNRSARKRYDRDDELVEYSTYTYNHRDLVTEELTYTAGLILESQRTYAYSEELRLVREDLSWLVPQVSLRSIELREYDDAGHLTILREYDPDPAPDGTLRLVYEFEYDAEWRKTGYRVANQETGELFLGTFEYDEFGNKEKETLTDAGGVTVWYETTDGYIAAHGTR